MTYKSILTYDDGDQASPGRLNAAIGITRYFSGHLTVAAISYEPEIPAYGYVQASGAMIGEMLENSRQELTKRVGKIDAVMRQEALLGNVAPVSTTYPSLARTFSNYARFADLVVLSRVYGEGVSTQAVDTLAGALIESDVATLICPDNQASITPTRVMIAWDGGRQAMRAVRRALPILKRADFVDIAMFDPDVSESDGMVGERLAEMLSRHDIKAELSLMPVLNQTVREAIERRLMETGADLLVMGAYGHSRFREYLFGGVTRELLERVPVPLFMAH